MHGIIAFQINFFYLKCLLHLHSVLCTIGFQRIVFMSFFTALTHFVKVLDFGFSPMRPNFICEKLHLSIRSNGNI